MRLSSYAVKVILSCMLLSTMNISSFKSPLIQRELFKTGAMSFQEMFPTYTKRTMLPSTALSLSSNNSPNTLNSRINKPTLTENSLWKLTIFMQKEGFQSIEATVRVRFIQSKNYEPPQGKVFIEDDYNGLVRADDDGYGGIWTLSEDKEDRKDGLWVWGLFEEPKYPFLYFYLDIYSSVIVDKKEYKVSAVQIPEMAEAPVVDEQLIIRGINSEINDSSYLNSVVKIEINNAKLASTTASASSSDLMEDKMEIPIFDGKSIPKNRLNFRFNFSQKSMSEGVSLSNGGVNYQLQEVVDADMFGLGGKVDVGEYVEAGRVNILYVSEA